MRAAQPPRETRPKQSARNYALWLLGRREWSAKELEQRLRLKGYEAPEIQDCLTLLAEHGLQSDERYADSRARGRGRLLGNRRLRQDLAGKGIDPELAEQAMAGLPPEYERAWAVAGRFQDKVMTPELSAKVWRFLASRGFGSDAIRSVVRRLSDPTAEVL